MTLDRRHFLGSALTLAGAPHLSPLFALDDRDDPQYGRTPRTRFAANVEMWWTRQPFLDRIRAAARFGFPAIEFWPYRGKELAAIAELTGELRIEVAQFTAWGFSPGLNDPANHARFEQRIAEACDVAHDLRCRKMTVVGGNDQPGMTQEQMHANITAGLQRVAGIAESADVMLILEPMNIRVDHKGHSLYGSKPAIEICRAVGSSHVKINWDLYHMQISEGDLCGHLREGIDQVGYLQLADTPGRHEPGTGEVNYSRVLKEAHDLGYRDYVGVECSPLEDELTAARRLAEVDLW